MADILIGTIVFGILGTIVHRMFKAHKKGESSCGHGCSGCPYACDDPKKH
ncbi:MAG: FeoB-associated Cys-rich membrane protein [Spirochaetae bacterium HGW-Spirochaetae-8]|nr:MAG: FeoB-associated Cys-rich membrane protein [Spirochaetae bacterium HGW-Spirochaetae-8]